MMGRIRTVTEEGKPKKAPKRAAELNGGEVCQGKGSHLSPKTREKDNILKALTNPEEGRDELEKPGGQNPEKAIRKEKRLESSRSEKRRP